MLSFEQQHANVVTVGNGPHLLLIHGTATDSSTWRIQARLLGRSFTVTTYDRQGAGAWPIDSDEPPTVQAHADHAAELVERIGESTVVVGASFGACVALELIRRRPSLIVGAVLCEPALPASDDPPRIDPIFDAEFRRLYAVAPARAAEFFLRGVMEEAYLTAPPEWIERCVAMAEQIGSEHNAIATYPPDYANLAAQVLVPVLLIGGGQSPAYFGRALERLDRTLTTSTLHTFPNLGHTMWLTRKFTARVAEFSHRCFEPRAIQPEL